MTDEMYFYGSGWQKFMHTIIWSVFDQRRCKCRLLFSLVLMAACFQSAIGAALRTQSFELKKGWNAIYLDVDPVIRAPGVVFAGVPVDIVASYEGTVFFRQYVADPNADLFKSLGWGTWYAPSREDSFLSELGAVYGKKSYLVHATEGATLSVDGTVSCTPRLWRADSYNLAGFSLSTQAPPTFATFFGGSSAHKNASIYRLNGGVWQKIIDTSNVAMKSGEAFWIYTDGPSSYQGPLEVTAGVGGSVVLRDGRVEDLILKNCTDFPINPSLEHVVPSGEFPLSIVVDVVGGVWTGIKQVPAALGNASWVVDLPALEADAGFKIPLALQSDKMVEAEVNSLLCIKSDLGTEIWVPLTGLREDLK
ncbi:MAG: hypothetical protein PF904_00970 [Kiritimatiellae bacterium]|jgi:hypothetical protein|nr:hypothetical protein [Kiritimatiellia bacterium]